MGPTGILCSHWDPLGAPTHWEALGQPPLPTPPAAPPPFPPTPVPVLWGPSSPTGDQGERMSGGTQASRHPNPVPGSPRAGGPWGTQQWGPVPFPVPCDQCPVTSNRCPFKCPVPRVQYAVPFPVCCPVPRAPCPVPFPVPHVQQPVPFPTPSAQCSVSRYQYHCPVPSPVPSLLTRDHCPVPLAQCPVPFPVPSSSHAHCP